MPRTRTDVRLEAAGLLLASLADRYPEAIASLRRELDVVDGYSSATMQPRVAATAELTSVERAADLRWTMTGDLDDLRDMAANIIELINTFQRQTDRALGVRAPVATRCKDALHGRDGSLEWGDPTCEELPVKAGLCTACYHREYRWRRSNDLGPRETVEAA
ncbi:MAG: hypothetical protein ACO3S5_07215 [Ilumatobacteraceae bacterium]|jgi:hypothetical protein